MDIRIENEGTKGRYVVEIDGHEAEMTFSRANPKLVIVDHTGVPDELAGRGIGTALAEFAVKDAREKGFRIIPLCPFLKGKLPDHPEWKDVMAGR